MRRFPDDRSGPGKDAGSPGHARTRARARARIFALRAAFVGAATCGIVLTAGGAAHADTLDASTVVSTTTQTVSSAGTTTTDVVDATTDVTAAIAATTADATTKTVDSAVKTVDTVTKTVDTVNKTVDTVNKTVDTVTKTVDTVTKTVDTVTKDVSSTLDDAAGGVSLDPLADVANGATPTLLGRLASESELSTAVEVRAGASAVVTDAGGTLRAPLSRSLIAAVAKARAAMLAAVDAGGVGTSPIASTPLRARSLEPPASPPPSLPSGTSTPAWPFAPSATGLALTLIGVILLRSTTAPPGEWRRHVLATIPFQGAAVALAVERPG
jgi:hypothetical protein